MSLLTQGLYSLVSAILNGEVVPSIVTMFGFGTFIGAISYLQFCEWRKENQKICGLENMKDITKSLEAV